MEQMSNKFGLPESLLDAVKKIQTEETEYQMKVKALMKKKGITSLGQLSPDEKKAFFNQLDAMHKAKHEEVELEEAIPKSTSHALVHSSSKKIIAKGNKAEMMKKMKELNAKEKGSHHLGMTNRGKVGDTFGEEVELEEGKSGTGYELYHKDFSSAMAHAYDFAKKKYNIEVDPQEIDRNVAMGPKKPSSGKANAYRLLDKTGKKAIQVQVTNLDNKRYELNMYKEEVEEIDELKVSTLTRYGTKATQAYGRNPEKDEKRQQGIQRARAKVQQKTMKKEEVEEERDPPFTPDKPKKNPGVVPGKRGVGPSVAKHLAKMAMKKQQQKKPMKNEEVEELDEGLSAAQIKKLRDAYASIDKVDVSSQPYKNLVAFLDKQDLKTLKMLAGAKIKFISGMAQNRVVRKMNESIGSTVGGALGQYAGAKMGLEGPGRAHGEVLGRQLEMFARAMLKKLTKEEIEQFENESEELTEDLMKLDPITNTLVAAAVGIGITMSTLKYWFGPREDLRKPIEKGLDKAKKDGNAKLYHSLAAKYWEDIANDYQKKLDSLRKNPESVYKKDNPKTGAKAGDLKKFERLMQDEFIKDIKRYKEKAKEFSAKERSGEPISKKYYESFKYKQIDEIELEESGGPVVWKKGNDHIEKYGDEKFALYKDGKKTKYYKSMDDAKAALEEAKDEGASKKKETEFHTKLDKLVHKTFGKRPEEKKEMKKEEVSKKDMKKEATGKEKPVKSGEKLSNKKEPITIDPEVDEKN